MMIGVIPFPKQEELGPFYPMIARDRSDRFRACRTDASRNSNINYIQNKAKLNFSLLQPHVIVH